MKFKSVDELDQISFQDANLLKWSIEEEQIKMEVEGLIIKARNSQNGRYQDMYSATTSIRLKNAAMTRVLKEGYRYYDANDVLISEVPDEEVPAPAVEALLKKMNGCVIFDAVKAENEEKYEYHFGIDVPKEEDEDEVDTYWVTIQFEKAIVEWDRYCNPVES